MELAQILSLDRIAVATDIVSKKKALERVAELLGSADDRVPAQAVADGLFARERLGSTALGEGVGLPHARIDRARRPAAAFLRLDVGIDFEAPDDAPVDLLFGLVVPEESTEEHLQILANLAELMSDASIRGSLRNATTREELLSTLTRKV